MSEVNGAKRNPNRPPVQGRLARWVSRVAVRVTAVIIIGLLSPHLPVEILRGVEHPADAVCVVDTRT